MATKRISLHDLREHLSLAKERIALDKKEILDLYPLPDDFSRDEYAFAYMRAERLGLRVINRRLAEIAWLPMQLDPKAEILAGGHQSMKRWLTSHLISKPSAEDFGNDFIHVLTRSGLKFGWEENETSRLATRIANLFRDLSCLIGMIYYCTWLVENNVEAIHLTNPDNICRSAEEIAALVQSPELYSYLRAKEQDVDKKIIAKSNSTNRKKAKPVLQVIENRNYVDPYLDPVTV